MNTQDVSIELDREISNRARIFSAVAVCFLAFFAIRSFFTGMYSYGLLLSGYTAITLCSHLFISRGRHYRFHNYLIVFLMGTLCLWVLHTGGEAGSGPLWYYVFPILALFVLGLKGGIIAIGLLVAGSMLVAFSADTIFDSSLYTSAMKYRLIAVFMAVTLIALFHEVSRHRYIDRLHDMYDELMKVARTDELTGLPNRRHMNESLAYEAHRSNRQKTSFSVILCDVDHFKKINDTYGHDCGDYVIRTVGLMIRDSLRHQDVTGRWGGEEFLVLLPETTVEGATIVAEQLREKIDGHRFHYAASYFFITLSMGVAEAKPPFRMQEYLHRADKNLYVAKERGRNLVIAA